MVLVHTINHGPVPRIGHPELSGSAAENRFGQNCRTHGGGYHALRPEPDIHVRQEFRDRSLLGSISSGLTCVSPITPTFSWNGDPCLLRAKALLFRGSVISRGDGLVGTTSFGKTATATVRSFSVTCCFVSVGTATASRG